MNDVETLRWKAFVLYALGIIAIIDLLFAPIVLLIWTIIVRGMPDLSRLYEPVFLGSILTGIIVSAVLEEISKKRKEWLMELAEEGRLMIFYGNLPIATVLLFCIGERWYVHRKRTG